MQPRRVQHPDAIGYVAVSRPSAQPSLSGRVCVIHKSDQLRDRPRQVLATSPIIPNVDLNVASIADWVDPNLHFIPRRTHNIKRSNGLTFEVLVQPYLVNLQPLLQDLVDRIEAHGNRTPGPKFAGAMRSSSSNCSAPPRPKNAGNARDRWSRVPAGTRTS